MFVPTKTKFNLKYIKMKTQNNIDQLLKKIDEIQYKMNIPKEFGGISSKEGLRMVNELVK